MVELDGIGRMLLQYFALKEEGAFVVFAQQSPVLLAHHGCQLLQVADHEQLYAAKGQVAVSKAAQYPVDGIEEVGPHHAYFVDDEEVETADEVDFGSAKAEGGGRSLFFGGQVVVGHLGAKRQLKKGVDGDAAGIDGGDAGGGHYGHALGAALLQLAQKGGVAGAGLAGEKEVASGVAYKAAGQFQARGVGVFFSAWCGHCKRGSGMFVLAS